MQREIEDAISEKILFGEVKSGQIILIDVDGDKDSEGRTTGDVTFHLSTTTENCLPSKSLMIDNSEDSSNCQERICRINLATNTLKLVSGEDTSFGSASLVIISGDELITISFNSKLSVVEL